MPTYIVGDIHISDPATYQAHLPRALATIARFGGRVIAGGGKIDLLEGDPMPEGIFIIEFQTAHAARRWYQSDDYQEALKVRLSSSRGRVFLIEGNEIPSAVPVAGLDTGKKLSLFRRRQSSRLGWATTLGTERAAGRGRRERPHGSPLEIAQPAMARMTAQRAIGAKSIDPPVDGSDWP